MGKFTNRVLQSWTLTRVVARKALTVSWLSYYNTPFHFIISMHGQDNSTSIFSRGGVTLQWIATTSCKSTWDDVPYFGINGLSMILWLCSPLHPLSKSLAIQDHAQNLEEQLWMGGRREVSIISHRPVTSSGFKQERSFFRGSVSTFLQLVVAVNSPMCLVTHLY